MQAVKEKSTEEKIKHAARELFQKQGYAATTTREIAAMSGINMALLHYYFRSKENLFGIIMMESIDKLVLEISSVLNDISLSFQEKLEKAVDVYYVMLPEEPHLPQFVLSELKLHPQKFSKKFKLPQIILKSDFIIQYQELVKAGKVIPLHPLQFMMNFLGLTLFPFLGSPIMASISNQNEMKELMEQRKKLIPIWIKSMITPLKK